MSKATNLTDNGAMIMADKKLLRIDLDELCSAMGDSSYEHEYYLDLETGEILFYSEYGDDKEMSSMGLR